MVAAAEPAHTPTMPGDQAAGHCVNWIGADRADQLKRNS
jgi:hypothetical protein